MLKPVAPTGRSPRRRLRCIGEGGLKEEQGAANAMSCRMQFKLESMPQVPPDLLNNALMARHSLH